MTIVQRIKGICLKPKEEWQIIAGESSSTADLLKNYVAPLAAIGAVAGFIGMSFIGVSAFGISVRMPLVTGLVGAVIGFVAGLVEVFAPPPTQTRFVRSQPAIGRPASVTV